MNNNHYMDFLFVRYKLLHFTITVLFNKTFYLKSHHKIDQN